jgi:hypothetical protein
MEITVLEKDLGSDAPPTNPGEEWTKSEWFHEWLRLARAPYHGQAADEPELPAQAA